MHRYEPHDREICRFSFCKLSGRFADGGKVNVDGTVFDRALAGRGSSRAGTLIAV